ncbi:SGNH/GDSL hydrolase family protein [Streptomyces sp. NPDC087263]|uniref:SGNH/GDSL hydrolase family protein n=1 Tax=Streptomyces sp. NPDC087263 TaxID=3365773 RepID=UPI003812842D
MILALMATLLFASQTAVAADTPATEDYGTEGVIANCAPPRECLEPTVANLERALTTRPNEAMFWTGRTVLSGEERSMEHVAAEIAAAEGGTTLEMALNRGHILMPAWGSGDEGRAVWVLASNIFADRAIGSVRVARGQTFRDDNIWDTQESLRIRGNTNVNILVEIRVLADGTRPRMPVHTRMNVGITVWGPTPTLGVTSPSTTCVRSVEALLTYFPVIATAAPVSGDDQNTISPDDLQYAATGNLYDRIRWYTGSGQQAAAANATVTQAAQMFRITGDARTAAGLSGVIEQAGLEAMLDPANCHPTDGSGGAWSTGSFRKRSLRVLAIGESITAGVGSADGAGYRKALQDRLRAEDNTVDFVGTQQNGDFGDPDNEGHADASIGTIDELEDSVSNRYRPNVVLINVGENDLTTVDAVPDTIGRLRHLVHDTLEHTENTTVVVSTLPADGDGPTDEFNASVHKLVIDEQNAGSKVLVADVGRIAEDGMSDATHPNDAGYAEMADTFYWAMATAEDMITDAPDLPGDTPGSTALKVMVVGDSMTQGSEGDWTWRYRLWQWFDDQDIDVDFVGPYTGTKAPAEPKAPEPPALQGEPAPTSAGVNASGGYAAGQQSFDSAHFAVWGRQAAQDKNLIREQVAEYQPDLLLVGLGFNDLGWFVSGPEGTLDSMKTLVDVARAAKPDIDFALANVPQRTRIGGREDLPLNTETYNQLLADSIPHWSTSTSPVRLVDWRGSYQCELDVCPDTYDGLHPNAQGEYHIAQAFERTLHNGYGLGSGVPATPSVTPARPTPIPGNVTAKSSPQGVTVTWNAVYGAHGYDVRYRIPGATDWTEVGVGVNRYDTTWTVDGITWEYQVRTDNGTQMTSDWSSVVGAVAHPQTVGAPPGMVTKATATGVDVSWGRPTGDYTDTIDRYQIITWDKDTPGAWIDTTAVRGLSVHIDGLIPGHHYLVAVATWNAAGGGLPGVARSVTVGAGTPPAPTGLRVTSTDATTVQLTWTGSSEAAGYRIWYRNITDGSDFAPYEGTADSPHEIAFLFPGVWNYEFCVTAINGAAESGKSNCVVAPRPAGS